MSHYYIGKIINKDESRQFVNVRNELKDRLDFINRDHYLSDDSFFTYFFYLGYMEKPVLDELLKKLDPFLKALQSELEPMQCLYDKYMMTGHAKTFKYLGITFKTEPHNDKDAVRDIIVPYIAKNYTKKYLKFCKPTFSPYIGFIKLNQTEQNQTTKQLDLNKLDFPSKGFTLDSIDIIKADPAINKKGYRSMGDKNDYEVYKSYPL